MNMETLITIFGALCTLALGINGYFLRGIFQDLNTVKIKLAEMSVRSESKERRIQDLERDVKDAFLRINKIEKECPNELCNNR